MHRSYNPWHIIDFIILKHLHNHQSQVETLVETHLASLVENTFQFWSWSELEMYWVAALLPAWFCYFQFTQRVQVELKWNRPQLCFQLRCHTNKGKNHFKNTPHNTKSSQKSHHSIPTETSFLYRKKKVLKCNYNWLLSIKAPPLWCSLLIITE